MKQGNFPFICKIHLPVLFFFFKFYLHSISNTIQSFSLIYSITSKSLPKTNSPCKSGNSLYHTPSPHSCIFHFNPASNRNEPDDVSVNQSFWDIGWWKGDGCKNLGCLGSGWFCLKYIFQFIISVPLSTKINGFIVSSRISFAFLRKGAILGVPKKCTCFKRCYLCIIFRSWIELQ